ncbi:3-isopropylmalate dehydratase small subunit [Rathayibacter tritici]|uniref:3-isopropylmalate dehydratase small subunit n=1 Tax=Rathayibacter tritici TaxID=33888 RepID=A0A160KQG4_9MICO|nr:3-isopropylmalate dehydratase small subunit [Rathayibacter tritici]AND15790.1 3-isopropylmalate dehydratase small subunit [Rathayibacter tritici]PPF26331.1 3-isopropylmalate dehydratase small subunit [Rathayibacter tritici]PPF63927.1 3-isopropylmalate dehydratase small subunit [Rathayibacter tritici]PPG05690.1 3-isopropylmalate dehydratase small subunit [Rathayibacter tritici]PPI15921.1 3-isopropylmalate dehydratase small subunit [Rathayibacter tritici]
MTSTPFIVHRGTAVPLRRTDVDTDQIIPARFCTRTTRDGHADALFADWRDTRDFVLNDPRYSSASILIAGRDFGTGSSREYAVWALQDYGFRVIMAPRFGDIFRGNALADGLLAIELSAHHIEALWDAVEDDPDTTLEVDLDRQCVKVDGDVILFDIDADSRRRLVLGQDQIDSTLQHEDAISQFEESRRTGLPNTLV